MGVALFRWCRYGLVARRSAGYNELMTIKNILGWLEENWVLTMLATGFVFFIITMLLSWNQSIWFDEGYSILLAKESFSELLALTSVDAHPPLYYLLLKVWGDLFGFAEPTLRALSALFAAGMVVGGLTLTRKLFGGRTALYVLPFAVLAPFVLRYGYEIRMYSLAGLIGVAATYALVLAKEQKTKKIWWIVYAALVALGMLTLYMTIAIWLSHVAWLVWSSVRDKLPIKKWRWLLAYVGAVLLFVPYLPTLVHQFMNSALPGIGREVTLTTLVDVVTTLLVFTPEWDLGGWLSLGFLALLVGVIYISVGSFKSLKKTKKYPYLALYCCLAGLPLLIFALLSLPPREPIFVVRYMAHVSIWVYLLLGVLLAHAVKGGKKIAYAVAATSLIVLLIGVVSLAQRGNFVFERMQSPQTEQIANSYVCNEDTAIVFNDPYTYIDSVFYFEGCSVYFVSAENVEKRGGYAMLHDSPRRITSVDEIDHQVVVFMHWGEPSVDVGQRYRLVESRQFDKQHVDVYSRTDR